MASFVTPKKNTQFIFYISLVDQTNTRLMKSSPTLATGDFKVSIDGGTLNDLGTLPTVTPSSSKMVKVTLSTSEMNGDNITLVCSDASGAEWCDLVVNIQTSARQIDDLAYPATSGRSMVVDASGLVDANTVKVGATGAGTAQTARDLGASVLISSGTGTGQLDVTSGVIKANLAQILGTALTETAGQIAAGFKQFFNIASPTSTMNLITAVTTAANLTTNNDKTGYTASTVSDKTGYSLSGTLTTLASQFLRVNTAQTGAAGSITLDASASATDSLYNGNWIAIVSGTGVGQSRLITGYTGSSKVATITPNWTTNPSSDSVFLIYPSAYIGGVNGNVSGSVGSVTGAVGSVTSGVTVTTNNDKTGYTASTVSDKTGYSLSSAGIQAIWDALTSALTTVGSIGKLLVDKIDATISSRATQTSVDTIDDYVDTEVAAIKAKTDQLTFTTANKIDARTFTNDDKTGYSLSSGGVQAIWDALTSALTTGGSIGKKLADLVLHSDNKVIIAGTTHTSAVIPTVTSVTNDVTMNKIKKNTALNAFMFLMLDSSDHLTPKTGLTVTSERAIDGGSFAATDNSVSEVGNGWYSIDLSAADLNGNTIALKFTATGADATNISIVTIG